MKITPVNLEIKETGFKFMKRQCHVDPNELQTNNTVHGPVYIHLHTHMLPQNYTFVMLSKRHVETGDYENNRQIR